MFCVFDVYVLQVLSVCEWFNPQKLHNMDHAQGDYFGKVSPLDFQDLSRPLNAKLGFGPRLRLLHITLELNIWVTQCVRLHVQTCCLPVFKA